MPTPTALTIAGSDSSGGAGAQADLKTFAAHGVYGTSAITAITSQNTVGVRAIHELPADVVISQIDAVAEDLDIHATKTGMLASKAIVKAVVALLERRALPNVVVDPVMVAKSGDSLLSQDALDAVQYDLLRLATVVTPNAAEAAVLADMPVITVADARRAAERIRERGSRAVIVKGGHLGDKDAVDVLVDEKGYHELRGPRIQTRATHGTGCTFAAAIAANLALGCSLRESADRAKQYVTGALQHGLAIGHGHGPLNHFWFLQLRRPERVDEW